MTADFKSMSLAAVDQTVVGWLEQLATQAREAVTHKLTVSTKGHDARNLVTNVDRSNEEWLDQQIRTLDPGAKVVSEEGFGDHPADMSGDVWFVDPIDGTMNFVHEHTDFAIMVAWYRDGEPKLGWIIDVMAHHIFHGGPEMGVFENDQQLPKQPDVNLDQAVFALSGRHLMQADSSYQEVGRSVLAFRVLGSAGITFARILAGQLNGYYAELQPWDFAAGQVMAKTLGLEVTNVDGKPLDMLSSNAVIVTTSSAHREVITLLKS
ncbi:inositol monophosphatase family protein [Leuconostocaceae bacterium ESL0723]|nr:inositol monophosphatase family protein [Leuconostocaceae bacterium ESL0723]